MADAFSALPFTTEFRVKPGHTGYGYNPLISIRDWIEHLLSEIEAGSGQRPPCWMVLLSLYFTVAQS